MSLDDWSVGGSSASLSKFPLNIFHARIQFLSHMHSLTPNFLILLMCMGAAVIEEHSDGTKGGEKERHFAPSASLHSTFLFFILRSIAVLSISQSQEH